MDNYEVENKLLVIRDIIRETLLGNAIILLAVYILSKSLPPQDLPDYGIIILTSITMTAAITWLFWITIIYIKKIIKKRTWVIIFLFWCILIQLACHYKINEIVTPSKCFSKQTMILKNTTQSQSQRWTCLRYKPYTLQSGRFFLHPEDNLLNRPLKALLPEPGRKT